MDALLAIYQDPDFLPLALGTNLVSMGAFLAFSLPLTWVAARDPAALRRFRIQRRPPKTEGLLRRSLVAFIGNDLALLAVTVLAFPVLRHSGIHGGPLPSVLEVLLQLVFFIYLDDFLYYWVHRAMHHGFLWKRVHVVHHRIHTPWAITGHLMHPVEFVVTAGLMLIGPLALGSHYLTLYLWVVIRQWEAAEGHCGYDFPFSPTHLLPGCVGALHHDYHHAKVKGNYAGFLAYLDRLFGTTVRGYEEARAPRPHPEEA